MVYPYEILGTREPILCDEFELHIDNICKKYGIEYLLELGAIIIIIIIITKLPSHLDN